MQFFLKLFGVNFWSLKLTTFLFLALFLLLASFLLYTGGGLVPVLLFHLFLVIYPHLLVPLGFEPYGEMATIVYILLAYLAFLKALQAGQTKWFFACGLLAGLTLITKIIGLFSLLAIFVLWFLLYAWQRFSKTASEQAGAQLALKHGLAIGVGLMILPALWEAIQMVTLTQLVDFETYKLHALARLDFIKWDSTTAGSNNFGGNYGEFMLAKTLIVSQISQPSLAGSALMFVVIAASGPWLAYCYRKQLTARNIILLLWLGWLIHTIWFISLSKQARVRHHWYPLIFGVMLFCWLVSYYWKRAKNKPQWRTLAVAGILTLIMVANFFSQRHAVRLFIPDSLVETWRLNFLSNDLLIGKYEQQMPWLLIPRDQQEEVVDYLTQLPPSSQIFYAANAQTSELPVIVGRIFYPIQRRPLMSHSNDDVVVIGSSIFSPWRRPQTLAEPIKQDIKSKCPQVLLENDYYIICSVTNP